MKRFAVAALCGGMALAAAAQWRPGTGVANDRVRGTRPHDVTFVARGGGNGYGYRDYDVAVGLTVLPWSCPNFESRVKGVRFNFGWGRYAGTHGVDTGLFSRSDDFDGVAVNLLGNYSAGDADGIQVGLVNVAGRARGLQVGLVNHVGRLEGVQIGLLNFATSQWTLPILNAAW